MTLTNRNHFVVVLSFVSIRLASIGCNSEPAFESLELKQIYEAAGAHPAMSCLQNDDGDLLIDVMLKEGPSQRVLVEKNVVLAEHGDRIGYYKVISIGKMYDETIAEDDARKMLLLNREVKGGFYMEKRGMATEQSSSLPKSMWTSVQVGARGSLVKLQHWLRSHVMHFKERLNTQISTCPKQS